MFWCLPSAELPGLLLNIYLRKMMIFQLISLKPKHSLRIVVSSRPDPVSGSFPYNGRLFDDKPGGCLRSRSDPGLGSSSLKITHFSG